VGIIGAVQTILNTIRSDAGPGADARQVSYHRRIVGVSGCIVRRRMAVGLQRASRLRGASRLSTQTAGSAPVKFNVDG
jgi:secreted protein with Ig-like and vWFA domain